ncbi:MAG: hypothetical protein DWQ47_15375 [Acidobacteria bacterium]|nr:MAG: hypothetical protein DWQ32_02775 [Acidobacteriota bacterium]REK02557.1 MAG: hypothetical protein DWQ38_09360 [Acidobacteriota bacterium]REK13640.1 MAG: hypothetical protein DWQ43_08465 [Acidobacteriota bacterium]REK41634.1 MAG: hypothetical protein DWQ47_15375 [Acidobacteriota bacterium]
MGTRSASDGHKNSMNVRILAAKAHKAGTSQHWKITPPFRAALALPKADGGRVKMSFLGRDSAATGREIWSGVVPRSEDRG